MLKYSIKRLVMALITIWAVITITFFIMHSIPGNPFAKEGRGVMPKAVFDNLQAYYNLDKPLVVQYFLYLKGLLQFDFGPSLKSQSITVNDYIRTGFPISLHLGLQAMVIAIPFGIIFGVIAALFKKTVGLIIFL